MIGRCFTGRGCSSGYVHPLLGKPDQIAGERFTPGLLLYLHLPPGPQHLQKQAIVRKHNPKLTEFIEYLLHSEYSVEEEQEIERIKVIMQELPPQCLKVFMLSAIEEKKYTEIADELSISVNTVKTHISKAYRLIRGQLHSEESLILWYWLMSQSTCLKSEMNIRL